VARRPRPDARAIAPVAWRDGVQLTGTPIWCDARRRRDVCFVSSADRVGRAGHGQLIATPITLALLGAGAGHLAVPLRKPFTLGTLRLELIAAGCGLGSASLHVDLGGRSVLYAGPVRTRDVAAPADVRSCDAVVVAAPVGLPEHAVPALAEAIDRVVAWARAQLAAGKRPVLVVDTLLDGLELATRLAETDLPLAASRALAAAAARVPGAPPLPATGRVLVRLGHERGRATADDIAALVSLRALDHPAGFAAALAWPFAADRAQLLAWIEHTGAREVFVTGACAESIVAALGARARTLGPPRQMSLFEAQG